MESHKTPWFQTTNQPLKSPLNHHTSGSLGKLDVFIPQAPHVHGKANVHQNSAFFSAMQNVNHPSAMVIKWYPLVNIQKAIEHGHRNSGFSLLKMVIFHSYVSLPEGVIMGATLDDPMFSSINVYWYYIYICYYILVLSISDAVILV